MYKLLRLQNFRSYQDYVVELSDSINIVVGPNASGKTNLLEGLYLASQVKTWRGRFKEVVADGQQWARLEAHDDSLKRVVKIKPPAQPQLLINDKNIVRSKRWQNQVPVILFDPDDLRLLKGSPRRRREYMDKTLTQSDALYANHLGRYERALAQRNRLLKNEVLNGDELFVWDLKLAEHGAAVITGRKSFVERLNSLAGRYYSEVAGHKHSIGIDYLSPMKEVRDIRNSLLKKLHLGFKHDRRAGHTTTGPHRDDLSFEIDKHPAQAFASRGETRSLVLALKIIEAGLAEEARGRKPIMLLDDVFSELDAARRRYLTEKLTDHQVIITTTDADAVISHFSSGQYKIIPTGS